MATSRKVTIVQTDFSTLELRTMAYINELEQQGQIVNDLFRKAMEADRNSEEFMNLYGSYRRAEEHLHAMQRAAINTGRCNHGGY